MVKNDYTLRYANDFPDAPDIDYSWHKHAACKDDPKAMEALGKSQHDAKRPWEPWCYSCPVRLHCLRQGLQEDEHDPHGGAPLVYGGLTPAERRREGENQVRRGLTLEAWRLKRKLAAEAS